MFENINWLTFIASLFAGIAALANIIYSYYNTRKTTFINVITSERIRWMSNLRETISTLCGRAYHWSITTLDEKENQQVIKEIDQLTRLSELYLNPDKPKHKEILDLLGKIQWNTDRSKRATLHKILDQIILNTQNLLIYEWEQVKKEAKDGELEQKFVYPWIRCCEEERKAKNS